MADVTVTYKGETIAELDGTGSKTLKTGGTYCEGDIEVAYAPRSRTYEITLAKLSGWVLLTELDADVLEHIDDETLTVSLVSVGEYAYEYYTLRIAVAANVPQHYHSEYPAYGIGNRISSATAASAGAVYYPASNRTKNDKLGGSATFCVADGNYYIKPSDGFIASGTYRLAFQW